jgi:membrane-associated protease RseP (regulator of RpoE activity)
MSIRRIGSSNIQAQQSFNSIFRARSMVTLNPTLSVEYLVVAGGGGTLGATAFQGHGGGGAGGYQTSSLTLNYGTSYTVTVGGGGAVDTNGSNSVFASVTSTGGGAGKQGKGNDGGSGAVIAEVQADSPADKAGLKVQDIVLEINDQAVTGQGALIAIIRDSQPGDTVTIVVERDGVRKTLTATLVSRPAE